MEIFDLICLIISIIVGFPTGILFYHSYKEEKEEMRAFWRIKSKPAIKDEKWLEHQKRMRKLIFNIYE